MYLDPEDQLKRLIRCHDADMERLTLLDSYYEGTQPLSYLAPELLLELEDRIRQVVIFWPQLVIDTLEERLEPEGFRLAKAAEADQDLWAMWQANNLDEESQQGRVDALVMGRSYLIVGSPDEDDTDGDGTYPLITVESPLEVYAERDPRTREVTAAVKRWSETDAHDVNVDHATLYLPDETLWYVKDAGQWVEDPDYARDEHRLGEVPVVPVVNRSRTRKRQGKSELDAIIPLSDAACKIATDMMVSAEFHAMPRRWALGMGPEDFEDEQGRKVSVWSKIAGRIWATSKTKAEGAEVGQFPEAQLSNFHATLELLAKIASGMAGMEPHEFGLSDDNPPSAESVRAREARLIKRAERRQGTCGGSYEETMRIGDRILTGRWRKELQRLETIWRDAATPTVAQTSDAAVKKFTAGIVPLQQTREDLGYTAGQIARMKEEDDKKAAQDPIGQMTKALGQGQPDQLPPAGQPDQLVPAGG